MSPNKLLIQTTILSIALLSGSATLSAKVDEEKRARICAKAEKQYVKIFGHPSSTEDATIVMMHKYTFCPPHITVKQGTTVRFVNVDKRTSHSVWFKQSGKDESSRIFGQEHIEMKFDLPVGKYPYLCGPHWKEDDMIGTVTVTP